MEKLNKKGQTTGLATGLFLGQLFIYSFFVFGFLQALAVWFPTTFGVFMNWIVTNVFMGSAFVFLLVAGGLIGLGVNEALERFSIQAPIFTKRTAAIFGFGLAVLLIGIVTRTFGGQALSQATLQAMILP